MGTGAWWLSETPAPYHKSAAMSWGSMLRWWGRHGEPGVISARASPERRRVLQRRERDLMGTSYL